MREDIGKIVAVYGPVVDVQFPSKKAIAGIHEIVMAKNYRDEEVVLEVIEHKLDNICRCIALSFTYGLRRNTSVERTRKGLTVPEAKYLYGRLLNVMGKPIDKKGPVKADKFLSTHRSKMRRDVKTKKGEKLTHEILETGVKVIDLLFPFVKGSKTGILGGAACGKSIIILELIHNIIHKQKGTCVFSGIGERIREGNELYYEFLERDLLKNSILVFGQMNESPGARFESARTSVTIAESLREDGQDVLFFVDNVFRFAQAGSEVSALLGRIPSETGYQPTLTSEIGEFHERIASTEDGSITSVEAVYVPADDLTDPAVVTIFSHLDSIMVLSREYVQHGLYPAIHPLESSSAFISSDIIGAAHYSISQEVLRYFQRYDELQRIVSIIGKSELTHEEQVIFDRARKLQNFLTQPFFVVESYTGKKGHYVSLEDTLSGCQKILSGRVDHISEEKFYMIGSLPA
ncbi:MAG: F0F1 ATP synthase subunit beta [PVC group bacterium]|nr:F0F1 ATP synthase subunit beta [PVC group bacterium]